MGLYIFTIALLFIVWAGVWKRYRDPAHPLVLTLPQFAFLYGVVPLILIGESERDFLFYAGGWGTVFAFQFVALLLVLGFVAGVFYGGRGPRPKGAGGWWYADPVGHRWLYQIAILFSGLSILSWVFQIDQVGGFFAAYGVGYGAGWSDSGYIREIQYLGVLSILLVYLYRSGRGMRLRDWTLILVSAAPTVVQGLLGARRGPTFIIAIVVFFGFYYFRNKKLNVALFFVIIIVLSWLLMFLVVNRNDIYLGSEKIDSRDLRSYFLIWTSNEYLLGSAVYRYGLEVGSYNGLRQVGWLFARLVPTQLWPTVYEDTANMLGISVNFFENGGVSREGIARITGWYPDYGSAEGYVGSLWLEFGLFSFFASTAIGLAFGVMWRRAAWCLVSRVSYFLALCLSIYLVMQGLDPWLYRFLVLAAPLWLFVFMLRPSRVDEKWSRSDSQGRQ